MSNVDWSLDDIIKANRKKVLDRKPMKNMHPSRKRVAEQVHHIPKGNIEGKWEHDLYQQGGESGNVLRIGNLPFDLDSSDFEDMLNRFDCEDIRPLFDDSNSFLGVADLTYKSNARAYEAMKQFKNCLIDGRRISVKLVSKNEDAAISSRLSFAKPVETRLRFRQVGTIRKSHTKNKKVTEKRRREFNFLDRLADDQEFIKEESEKRMMKDLDKDLEAYMKRAKTNP